MVEPHENAGIVNVPDYLGVSRDVKYFINEIGLFPTYLKQILAENGVPEHRVTDNLASKVYDRISHEMTDTYHQQSQKFEDLYNQIIDFYKPIFRLNYVGELGLKILDEESSTKG